MTSWDTHSVFRYDASTGALVDEFVARQSGHLREPWGIVISPHDGDVYVGGAHFGGRGHIRAVQRYDGTTGAHVEEFVEREQMSMVHAVTFGPDGHLYVGDAEPGAGRIARFNGLTGAFIDDFVDPGAGGLEHPYAHVFAPSVEDPQELDLYVTDGDSGRVVRYDGTTGAPRGTFVAQGTGGLTYPAGLTFGPDGHLYVADIGNANVVRFQGPGGPNPGAFIDTVVPAGRGGLLDTLGLLFGPDGNGDGHQDLYVNSQELQTSLHTRHGSSSVKLYDGVTGAFIRDFVPANAKANGGLDGPDLMTFTETDPVTLTYNGAGTRAAPPKTVVPKPGLLGPAEVGFTAPQTLPGMLGDDSRDDGDVESLDVWRTRYSAFL